MIEYNFFNDHTYKTLSDHGPVISKHFLEAFLYSAATSEQQKQWRNIPPVYLRRKMNLRINGAEVVFFTLVLLYLIIIEILVQLDLAIAD